MRYFIIEPRTGSASCSFGKHGKVVKSFTVKYLMLICRTFVTFVSNSTLTIISTALYLVQQISHSHQLSIITYGCLCQLLAWAKAKKQSCKLAVGNTEDIPTDLSGIVHTVINKIHTFGANSGNVPSVQLKSTLPVYVQ